LPVDEKGRCLFERIISYTDTADEGSDSLCSIVAGVYRGEAWILDVYFTAEPMEVTEIEEADFLVRNKVNIAKIESNNGGKGFARNVERLIWERHRTKRVLIDWFHQSANKVSRILTNSSYIINHIYFPQGWSYKYESFYNALMSYQKEGKNKHDDAPDCLTGIAEMVENNDTDIYLLKGGQVWG
jgi:predicted phage terminase large subunit-like protein